MKRATAGRPNRMPALPVGELAALTTATCWVGSALAFETASRRIGSLVVNLLRLIAGFVPLALTCWIVRGTPLPTDASAHAWSWLAVSGLVGFTFGDLCLFRAFVVMGSRLSMLVMSLAPAFAALFGWALLGEVLTPRDLVGMALTLGGVAWAVAERRRTAAARAAAGPSAFHFSAGGVALALGGALGQGGGLVLSKLGMGDYDPFAATQIRVLAGAAGYAALFSLLGWWRHVRPALADRRALAYTGIGAFFGPFLGVSLSLLAVQRTATGVAASIMAITPVLIIPVVVATGRERVGPGGIAGALLAVAGVAVLFSG